MTVSRIGPVEVLATLGQGAKSTVVHVRRAADRKEYALKLVPVGRPAERKYLAQARQEFRVGRLLDHPSLVKVFALETETDWLLRPTRVKLLLEFVPGRTLDRVPAPPVRTLLRVFERAADGVAYMHDRGVVHADLKPNNIMLGPGVVKVIDYGLARVNGESAGRLQGTPEYMAPETAARKVVNERTDVFNFGATMYRLTTGRLPPTLTPGLPLGERAYLDRLRPVGGLNPLAPAGLCDLIHHCLAYHPGGRPGSMDEVCRALARLVDECEAGE